MSTPPPTTRRRAWTSEKLVFRDLADDVGVLAVQYQGLQDRRMGALVAFEGRDGLVEQLDGAVGTRRGRTEIVLHRSLQEPRRGISAFLRRGFLTVASRPSSRFVVVRG